MQRIIATCLQGAIVLGLTATVGSASANCPGGTFYVTSQNDPSRYFFPDTGFDMRQDGDLNGNCSGSIAWRSPSNTNVSIIEFDGGYSYQGTGNFKWTTQIASSLAYSAVYRTDGSLTVFYKNNNINYNYIAKRTDQPRRIKITNQNAQAMTNVQITLEGTIGGNKQFDWEAIGDFSANYTLGEIAFNGAWDGTKYVGDFLYKESTSSTGSQRQAVIAKLDYRDFSNVRVAVWFVINGQQYTDYQDLGNWNAGSVLERGLILNTAGVNSYFDGTAMVGDFLR